MKIKFPFHLKVFSLRYPAALFLIDNYFLKNTYYLFEFHGSVLRNLSETINVLCPPTLWYELTGNKNRNISYVVTRQQQLVITFSTILITVSA